MEKEIPDDCPNAVEIIRKPRSAQKPKTQEDLDLTGSPLKASFTLEDNDDEHDDFEGDVVVKRNKGPSFYPLHTETARKIISSSKPKDYPMFAVCSNDDQTLYLGKSFLENDTTTYKVEYLGTSNTSSYDTAYKDHLNFLRFDKEALKTIRCGRALLNLSDPTGENDPDKSNVKLRLKWSNPKAFLETPPESASNVELLVDICFNDERSGCQSMLDELELLKNFKYGLQNKGIKWRKRLPEDDDVIEELRELLFEVKQQGPRPVGRTSRLQKPAEHLEDLKTLTLTKRDDADLTDKLWNVLKKVESFAQLSEAWKQLFQIFRKDDIKPYISYNNSTKVAKLIKNLVKGEEVPDSILHGSGPLELLYEIGVEKLQRDYSYPILFNLLATRDDMEGILQESDCILRLEKLHCIQEIINLCQTFLSPSPDCLRIVILQALQTLTKWPKLFEKPKFIFNISGSHVKDQIERETPVLWQCQFFTKGSKLDLETTIQYSLEYPNDVIKVEVDDDLANDESSAKTVTYHEIKATAVSRRL